MFALRLLGAILAVVLLAVSVPRYRRRQISRLNLIISWLIGLSLIVLAILPPGTVGNFFRTLDLEPKTGRILTVVLTIAVVILFLLVFRMQAYVDSSDHAIRQLVEALGVKTVD